MYCPQCGKAVPNSSKFCLYCGTQLPDVDETSNARIKRETPPISVEAKFFDLQGPSLVKSGGKIVGRGFKFIIVLCDEQNQFTASDGELIVALTQDLPTPESSLRAARAVKKAKETVYYDIRRVSKGDFYWTTNVYNYGVRKEELVYSHSHLSPPVFARALGLIGPQFVNLYVWFITPDKKCLFSPGGICFWTV